MKTIGRVEVPQEAFVAALSTTQRTPPAGGNASPLLRQRWLDAASSTTRNSAQQAIPR